MLYELYCLYGRMRDNQIGLLVEEKVENGVKGFIGRICFKTRDFLFAVSDTVFGVFLSIQFPFPGHRVSV